MPELESWVAGIVGKRPLDCLRVLIDLLEAARAHGQCSANDVRQVGFQQPNVIGATFKLLPSFGIKWDGTVTKSNHKTRKNGLIRVWKVEAYGPVNTAIDQVKELLASRLSQLPRTQEQGRFL